jgi:hypothetical protein
MAKKKEKTPISVEALKHEEATRKNIPTAEYQAVLAKTEQAPVRVAMERRNRDLDPQLVWRGKDAQDDASLVVQAAPLYIQEKVHPKVLVDDLRRQSEQRREAQAQQQSGAIVDLFADFNGLPNEAARTELPTRRALGQPLHPRRFTASDGEPRRARRLARQGAVHLLRSTLRHQIQQQLPVVHHQPRREGRQRGAHHP